MLEKGLCRPDTKVRCNENFLKVMAERYDNNPNVAFMDIGSYGTWGEGHTVHASRIDYPFATYKAHIDLHCKYFKNTQLCISDDVDGWNNTSGNYPVMDYALSQADDHPALRSDGGRRDAGFDADLLPVLPRALPTTDALKPRPPEAP